MQYRSEFLCKFSQGGRDLVAERASAKPFGGNEAPRDDARLPRPVLGPACATP